MTGKSKSVLSGAGFYTVLLLCLVAVGAGAYFLLFRGAPSGTDGGQPAAAAVSIPAEAVSPAAGEKPVAAESVLPEKAEAPAETAETVETVDDTPIAAEAPSLVVSPLRGEVVAAFSVDALQYSQTLEDWRTHDGIDIAAAQGTKVLAASAGTVLSVSDDSLMGTTVVLGHSGGYQTTYANLQSQPNVKKGDSVSAGQVLGAVGTTSLAESAEGPHLHFSVTENGDAVDPEAYLKK